MNREAKVGAMVDISVLRKDGTVDHCGEYHNIMGSQVFSEKRMCIGGTTTTFRTLSQIGSESLSGTYSVVDNILYRVSGSLNLTSSITIGDIIEFPGVFNAYKAVNGVASLSATLSRSYWNGITNTIPESTVIRHKTQTAGFGTNPAAAGFGVQSLAVTNTTNSVSAISGTIIKSISAMFSPSTSNYTLHTITYTDSDVTNVGGVTTGNYFNISPPISINIGDSVLLNNFTWRLLYDYYEPKLFGTSPLINLTGSGRYQKLTIVENRIGFFIPTTIWLLSSNNAVIIPNAIDRAISSNSTSTTSTIPINSFTSFETITAIGTSPAVTADATESTSCYGVVSIGGYVKQIMYGIKLGANAHTMGIIEYDTPQYIPAGKIITIGSKSKMIVEMP